MNAKESTSLTVGQQYALSTAPPMGELLQQTFGSGENLSVFDLPQIKVPAGGAQSWELPDGETAKSFKGILVHRTVARVYWRNSFGAGEGTLPPDCRSEDGKVGIGEPGVTCSTCKLNQWGTAVGSDGKPRPGKACRELNRLFIIREGDFLPSVLTAPPSALAAIRHYLVTLLASGTSHWAVETTIGLERNTAPGGISYSVPTLTRGDALDPALLERVNAVRAELGVLLPRPDYDEATWDEDSQALLGADVSEVKARSERSAQRGKARNEAFAGLRAGKAGPALQ